MTLYSAQRKRGLFYRDSSDSMVIEGYDYTPATPNGYSSWETYRPVTLEWYLPDNGSLAVMLTAVNGYRGNRVYAITTPGATNTYGVMVNGVHIPVQFNGIHDAKLFAQHIEDTNTEG